MEVLYFFESIRNPFLDALMSILTFLGSEVGFLAFAIAFYWCVDKKRGYYIMSVGFLGVIVNQVMKILFMIPRPWVLDPEFTVVDGAKEDAGGYSFPSGHTQNSTGTFGAILRFTKKNWLRIMCSAFILIVPITRMYLGVHTPLDVGVSLLIGGVIVLALYPVFELTRKNEKYMYILLGSFFAVTVAFALFAFLYVFPSDVDQENLYELRKNACTLLGAVGGVLAIYPIETNFIKFNTKASLPIQILKLVVGLATVIGIKEGLKKLFVIIGGGDEVLWMRSLRYFVIVAFAMGVFPLLFKLFAKLEKSNKGAQN